MELFRSSTTTKGNVQLSQPYTDFRTIVIGMSGDLGNPVVFGYFHVVAIQFINYVNGIRVAGYSTDFIQGHFSANNVFTVDNAPEYLGVTFIYGIG